MLNQDFVVEGRDTAVVDSTRTGTLRVKICGLTRLEDALWAVKLGAHALGFIFYPKSPRYIPPEQARRLISQLPPYVTTVGVFVNASREEVTKIVEATGIDLVQLHGQENPEFCSYFFPKVVKAFRVRDRNDLKEIPYYQKVVRAILLDTFVPGAPGGTGRVFDWSLALEAQKYFLPVVLAGGLNPENIAEAVKTVKPAAVDVNSGIEIAPGIKDLQRLKALFKALSPFLNSG